MPRLSKGLQLGNSFKIFAFDTQTPWGERYRAVHLPTQRVVAIHLLNKLAAISLEGARAIVKQNELMKGIIHKNVVESFGGGYLDPERRVPYIAQAHIEGETIGDYISRKYPLGGPITATRLILFHLTSFLDASCEFFHHGALTSSNILISTVGRVMIKEFGLVLAARDYIPLTTLLPEQELPFLAPEIKEGGDASPRSDLFSVGAIANLLLSGKLPTPEGLPQLKPEIHKSVVEAITTFLEQDPNKRQEISTLKEAVTTHLKERKRSANAVIMVDLLESFREDDQEEKKFMVQKGRLDYGPYSSSEILEKAVEEIILPEHLVVNIDSGIRKRLDKHPDFIDFMTEFLRRMELKRREEAEAVVEIKEKQQSRTFKLAIALGIVGVVALAATILLYKTVVNTGGGRRRNTLVGDQSEIEVALEGSKKKKGKKKKRRRRRRRRRRRSKASSSSSGAGEEIKEYALDNMQLTRTQINAVVDASVISRIARSCIPATGRIYIGYQINGRRGRIAYASAKLNGKKNKKISRCAYGILKRLHFPKMNTDISGFGGISY